MMSRYLAVVDDLFYIRSMGDAEPEIAVAELSNFKSSLQHIIAEIPAVGARISDEFALIERLRIVKCLLCRIAESLVCFSLERGQVIQLRALSVLTSRLTELIVTVLPSQAETSVSAAFSSSILAEEIMNSPQLRSAV